MTSLGVTNWTAAHVEENMLITDVPTSENLIPFEEKLQAYKFIDRQTPLYEIGTIFKESFDQGRRLEMLLITQNGRPHESLLGTITPHDLIVQQ